MTRWQQQQQQQLVDVGKGLGISEEAQLVLIEDEVASGRLLQQLHNVVWLLQAGSAHVQGNSAAAAGNSLHCDVAKLCPARLDNDT